MGRTILYILIGVSVVGALAVLLLLAPATETIGPDVDASTPVQEDEAPVETDVSVAPEEEVSEVAAAADDSPAVPEVTEPVAQEPSPVAEVGFLIDGTITSGEYADQTALAGVDVYWTNDAQSLRVGLVSPGTGYVAIGFEPERQMEGANFIIASMHEGVLTIRDDYGYEAFSHMEDTARGGTNDILTAAGNEWPDQTVVEFAIPLDSGDTSDKPLTPGQEITILVAYHSMLDDFSNRHTRQATGTIVLQSAP